MPQAALRDLWLSAPAGRMSAWQQAKALGLREASRELHKGRAQLEWIADRVEKVATALLELAWLVHGCSACSSAPALAFEFSCQG